jgi:hypothetical protein
LELHDDAPKRVTTRHAAIVETEVKGFHPEPQRVEGTHNDAPKRVTTPASIAAIGVNSAKLSPRKTFSHVRKIG